jgi:hypothetical protein
MFTDAFIKCLADENISFLKRLDQEIKSHSFINTGLILLKKQILFYPGATYYELTQADQHPSKTMQVIVSEDRFYICNGNVDQLLELNKIYPLSLDKTLVLDYVHFYFAHTIGPRGISKIIDTVDDLQMKEEPNPVLRKALHDKIVPLVLNAGLTNGEYQMRGTILVEQTIFSTFINVNLNGQVTVELGRVLADLLPISSRILES